MKIATEIGWAHKSGGARRVAINTLLEMVKLRPDNQYIVYSNCELVEFNNAGVHQNVFSRPCLVPQVVWDQFLFPHLALSSALRKDKPDVIHFTNNIVSYFGSVPAVVTIHDMLPFVLPESFVSLHGAYQRAYFKYAVKKAKKIITDSENSKTDICRILQVKEEKIKVIPLGTNLSTKHIDDNLISKQIKELCISKPFILYAGAIHPRKNIGRLIEAFSNLKREKKIPHVLVIAGVFRWKKNDSINTESFDSIKDDVVFTGRVNDEELISLYKQCDVFVYPSLYEGFGLPVLEAMSFGAPVVTSNTSSLPEVAGDGAVLVDPENIGEIAEGIFKIIDNRTFAELLRNKGKERAALFSWENTTQKVLDVLESVV
ncbi:glycosyltransferase family 4 protein [Chlamydiota bacterium]